MKLKLLAVLLLFFGSITVGCQSTRDTCIKEAGSVKKWPKRIYVPGYYVYRGGKYQFIDGHYRWVIFPKLYEKRMLQGYASKRHDPASIR